jgi:hypothetical protein
MKLPTDSELRDFVVAAFPSSVADRMAWYFDRFWLEVAEQNGYAYPAAFPEGSALAEAHNTAHARLVADIAAVRNA